MEEYRWINVLKECRELNEEIGTIKENGRIKVNGRLEEIGRIDENRRIEEYMDGKIEENSTIEEKGRKRTIKLKIMKD